LQYKYPLLNNPALETCRLCGSRVKVDRIDLKQSAGGQMYVKLRSVKHGRNKQR